jgi:isoleucyl-tRNA synthetase
VWAASVDYTRDVSIGPSAIKHASETLRKIRSAMRFLLANTSREDVRDIAAETLGPVSERHMYIHIAWLIDSSTATFYMSCLNWKERRLKATTSLRLTRVRVSMANDIQKPLVRTDHSQS